MHATVPLFDSAALRTLESRATAALGGDAFELMRRAGHAAWKTLLRHWPQAHRIVVLCGPGNNGGDGYVLARHAQASGRQVTVLCRPEHAARTGQAQQACREYVEAGGVVSHSLDALGHADLVIDALFGIGLSRAPEQGIAEWIRAVNGSGVAVFSLDAPSGVDADTGNAAGDAIRATRCLQFIAGHAGLRTGAAPDYTGELALADLDLPATSWTGVEPVARLLSPASLADFLAPRARASHKGDHGHVLCVGGAPGMGGAIALCAEAALRSGAGLVTVATDPGHVPALLARRPECMGVALTGAADMDAALQRADVVAIGPGLGRVAWGRSLFEHALDGDKPVVVDADALFHLAQSPRALRDAVITPHPGEAARLLAQHAPAPDRFATARALVERFQCAVVLKGAGSIVAAPGQVPYVIDAGNPGMAVGGMGDVLTGVVAALRAQGMHAFNAAACGALLHAVAGDVAARGGERGLVASDLFDALRTLANPQAAT